MKIINQKSNPYTPEQNGRSERMNTIIIDEPKLFLFEGKLDRKFCTEDIKTDVYLIESNFENWRKEKEYQLNNKSEKGFR